MGAIVSGAHGRGRAAGPGGVDVDARGQQVGLDPTVEVGAVHTGSRGAQPGQRRRGWVAVVVARAHRDRARSTGAWRLAGRPIVAVALPWWATLRTSSLGRPRARSAGIHVLLGVAGEQEVAPGRRAEQHDRDVVDVPSGGAGRRGHRARLRPAHLEPDVAQRELRAGGERSRAAVRAASAASQAFQPGPDPCIPGSNTRPTRYRSSTRTSPATWSSCGCVSTTMSMRRSQGGTRGVEFGEDAVRVGPAVDEHPARRRGSPPGSRRPGPRRARRAGPRVRRRPLQRAASRRRSQWRRSARRSRGVSAARQRGASPRSRGRRARGRVQWEPLRRAARRRRRRRQRTTREHARRRARATSAAAGIVSVRRQRDRGERQPGREPDDRDHDHAQQQPARQAGEHADGSPAAPSCTSQPAEQRQRPARHRRGHDRAPRRGSRQARRATAARTSRARRAAWPPGPRA